MKKRFNITGTCRPSEHYMADVSNKFNKTFDYIEFGDYFIINRPRQYGKTTMLYSLAAELRKNDEYVVFNTSFEGIGDAIFDNEVVFTPGFIWLLIEYAEAYYPDLVDFLKQKTLEVDSLASLSKVITEIVIFTQRKVVILIDEVDKSSNNQLFVNLLAMLRNKYLSKETTKTFHSIVLAGVHDVKSLKMKIRPDAEQKYNSPWNIAAEYTVDMNLYPDEIKPMLDEYAIDRGVVMNTQQIANRLFYYTSGYPFLVSKLCKMFDESYLPQKSERTWTDEDVDMAAKQLVTESNTNFDTQIKNLENNPELYQLVYRVAVDNEQIPFNIHDPVINFGSLYGIFVNKNGLSIHNRIYQELLLNYMTIKMVVSKAPMYETGPIYKNDDGTLNMESVLIGFQAFMKKEYNKKDRDFLEKNGRLVFLAFLKPILNGAGHDFKEPQISEERRLDVVVTYLHQKFVAELKIWRGEKLHQKGLQQLSDYLDTMNLTDGYLLIFDHSEIKNWTLEWITYQNKRILIAWV